MCSAYIIPSFSSLCSDFPILFFPYLDHTFFMSFRCLKAFMILITYIRNSHIFIVKFKSFHSKCQSNLIFHFRLCLHFPLWPFGSLKSTLNTPCDAELFEIHFLILIPIYVLLVILGLIQVPFPFLKSSQARMIIFFSELLWVCP